ncbi:hypothetical protein [Flavobacterium alkalisoli]|uniref:hypothetical protein n=1 Tax=Flavobacterium alkalisoli TaxID=2602769 RepID=UPI003A93A6F6
MKKHLTKITLLLVISLALIMSCQNDDTLKEESTTVRPDNLKRISVEDVLKEIEDENIKNKIIELTSNGIFKNFDDNESSSYFDIIELYEFTQYTLFVNRFSERKPYNLYYIVTIDRENNEHSGFIKYIPIQGALAPEDISRRNFIGTLQLLSDNMTLIGQLEMNQGQSSTGTYSIENCTTYASITMTPCSHGGEHAPGEQCQGNLVNDAYYSVTLITNCTTEFNYNTPPGFVGGIGAGPTLSDVEKFLTYLNQDQLDFFNNNTDVSDIINTLIEYGNTSFSIYRNLIDLGRSNKPLLMKILNYTKDNNYSIESRKFVGDVGYYLMENNLSEESIEYIDQLITQMLLTNSFFDVGLSQKSPCNIDMTSVQGNSVNELRFRNIYNKIIQSNLFKQLFVNLFETTDFVNVKFLIEDIPDPSVSGNSQLFHYSSGGLLNIIKIDTELLNDQSDFNIALTIIHECIHAYLSVKLAHPEIGIGMPISNINNLDFSECINESYNAFNGPESQHDFFVDYMRPTIINILTEIKNIIFTPELIERVETPSSQNGVYIYAPTNTIPPTNSGIPMIWDWNDFFSYSSLIGLQNCDAFHVLYPLDSVEYYMFTQYYQAGITAFTPNP